MKTLLWKGAFALLLVGFVACSEPSEETKKMNKEEWAIALHGGAGGALGMSPEKQQIYKQQLEAALTVGKEILEEGGSSLDAVTQVVVYLENCPLFNAGRGAVLNKEGIHELDAAIMDGSNLQAGAIAGVRDLKNPILTARRVMTASPHVLLMGEGASAFAAEQGMEKVPNSYFSTAERQEQLQRIMREQEAPNPKGTVGCVALDCNGNLAAATSTGGMSGKQWGRVGDAPIIGAGTYANNQTVAVSGTGHGELWIRRSVAFDINALMDYKGLSVEDASNEVIFNKIAIMKGSGGGVICVDKNGNIAMPFCTEMMFRAWATASGQFGSAVYKDGPNGIDRKL